MKEIIIGLSSPNTWKIGAEIIKVWIGANYSHVYVRFPTNRLGLSNIYQASHGMVHFREHNNFLKDNKTIKEFIIQVTDEQYDLLMKECMLLAGEGYGYKDLVRIACMDILNRVGIQYTPKDGKGYICSELAGKLCSDVLGIHFDKPKYLLTPVDIDEALSR